MLVFSLELGHRRASLLPHRRVEARHFRQKATGCCGGGFCNVLIFMVSRF